MAFRSHLFALFVHSFFFAAAGISQTSSHTVLIETSQGSMKCILYQETPMHSDNFVKLARDGFYDGLLFHRVIRDFMIQSGDPLSRNSQKGAALGYGDAGYTIPAEFHPALYHKKGALAAARQGDRINPNRASNGSQFYIVQGKKISEAELSAMEKNGSHISFTSEQRTVYTAAGGAPHLDYAYTVFGEVIEGFETIDRIAAVPADERNRPLEDVRILRITVLK